MMNIVVLMGLEPDKAGQSHSGSTLDRRQASRCLQRVPPSIHQSVHPSIHWSVRTSLPIFKQFTILSRCVYDQPRHSKQLQQSASNHSSTLQSNIFSSMYVPFYLASFFFPCFHSFPLLPFFSLASSLFPCFLSFSLLPLFSLASSLFP